MPGVSRIAPVLVLLSLAGAGTAAAQGTVGDYQRAMGLREAGRTLQVNQLIKHNKEFDLLVVPGMDHGSGDACGDHKRYDFFVRNLLGVAAPDWKTIDDAIRKNPTTD